MTQVPDTAIYTHTGKWLDFADPQIDQICIEDIAWALSKEQRFANQGPEYHYSVARHSLFVASLVPKKHRLVALLHEAPEAYMRDIPGPLKRLPELDGYKTIERMIWSVVAEKYGLPEVIPPEVKEADAIILATEKRDVHKQPAKEGEKKPMTKEIKLTIESRFNQFYDLYGTPAYSHQKDFQEFKQAVNDEL